MLGDCPKKGNALLLSLEWWVAGFHLIGPLGRFGLVVTMSVRILYVSILSPSHAIFLRPPIGPQ